MFLANNKSKKSIYSAFPFAFLLFLQFVLLQQPITAQNSSNKICLENLPDEISFCIADLKFDGSMIKICEFGACIVSKFEGHEALFGKEATWSAFWDILKSLNLPIWYIKSHSPRDKAIKKFLRIGGKLVKNLHQIEHYPLFKKSQKQYNNKKGIKNHTGIVIIGNGVWTPKEEEIAFRKKYPNLLILGEVSNRFVENKCRTNELFDDPEISIYKPKCKTYQKKYTPELAQNIIDDLCCEIFVIKPPNAARGSGINIVTKKELDKTLKLILTQKNNLKKTKKMDDSLSYWKHDNNDFFIVEEFVQSKSIEVEGKLYDPTMRMIFSMIHDAGSIDINFVGAYWKLPAKSLDQQGSLTEKHKSKTDRKKINSVVVCQEDLNVVESLLRQVLPKLYIKMLHGSPGPSTG